MFEIHTYKMSTTNKNFLQNPSLTLLVTYISLSVISIALILIVDEDFFSTFTVLHWICIINVITCLKLVGRYFINKTQQV